MYCQVPSKCRPSIQRAIQADVITHSYFLYQPTKWDCVVKTEEDACRQVCKEPKESCFKGNLPSSVEEAIHPSQSTLSTGGLHQRILFDKR